MGAATHAVSQVQFLGPLPVRISDSAVEKTTSPCSMLTYLYPDHIWLRFRFKSDNTTDTLAGWRIDSIGLRIDLYPGQVSNELNTIFTQPVPNPSPSGIFIFPDLPNSDNYKIELFNAIGCRVKQSRYTKSLDLSRYPRGWYYFLVTDGKNNYRGNLLFE
jgi:hypothetical protein